jgi:hypothetical protein
VSSSLTLPPILMRPSRKLSERRAGGRAIPESGALSSFAIPARLRRWPGTSPTPSPPRRATEAHRLGYATSVEGRFEGESRLSLKAHPLCGTILHEGALPPLVSFGATRPYYRRWLPLFNYLRE